MLGRYLLLWTLVLYKILFLSWVLSLSTFLIMPHTWACSFSVSLFTGQQFFSVSALSQALSAPQSRRLIPSQFNWALRFSRPCPTPPQCFLPIRAQLPLCQACLSHKCCTHFSDSFRSVLNSGVSTFSRSCTFKSWSSYRAFSLKSECYTNPQFHTLYQLICGLLETLR